MKENTLSIIYGGVVILGLFFIVSLTIPDSNIMSQQDINNKVEYCKNNGLKPWFTFIKQGDKDSGTVRVDCVDLSYPNDEGVDMFNDDSMAGVPGFGQVTGSPGSPF